ncbi:hypothetical protein ACQFYA_00990 [Promicromonospora sp. Marseille-Q5078]
MDEVFGGECAACGHERRLHAVAIAVVRACASCIAEEDHDQRDDVCTLWPPEADLPAHQVVRARLRRGRWGGTRLTLDLRDGRTWAVARRGTVLRTGGIERLGRELATMTLGDFWERHFLGFR